MSEPIKRGNQVEQRGNSRKQIVVHSRQSFPKEGHGSRSFLAVLLLGRAVADGLPEPVSEIGNSAYATGDRPSGEQREHRVDSSRNPPRPIIVGTPSANHHSRLRAVFHFPPTSQEPEWLAPERRSRRRTAMAVSSIGGVAETVKALEGLKKSTARGVIERVLKRAAKSIEAAAKSAAPVDTGQLRRSISTKIIRTNAGKAAFAAAKRAGASSDDAGLAARAANKAAAGAGLSAIARVSATAPHAPLVEYGTHDTPAQPFLGPAFRSKSASALSDIKSEIAREVSATTKRVAARAAKKVKIT